MFDFFEADSVEGEEVRAFFAGGGGSDSQCSDGLEDFESLVASSGLRGKSARS